MKVKLQQYVGQNPCISNIMWEGYFPMRGGKFPRNHPAQLEAMERFRGRGYWASCFPEGDGITFYAVKNKTLDETVADIEACFGWTVLPA